jgi:hypothetical protein
MPELERELVDEQADFSGGMQEKTSRFTRRSNELKLAENARFGKIGGIAPATGFNPPYNDLTSTTSTSSSTSTTTTSTSTSTSTSTTTSTSTS